MGLRGTVPLAGTDLSCAWAYDLAVQESEGAGGRSCDGPLMVAGCGLRVAGAGCGLRVNGNPNLQLVTRNLYLARAQLPVQTPE